MSRVIWSVCVLLGLLGGSVAAEMIVRVPEDRKTIEGALAAAPAGAVVDIQAGNYPATLRITRPVVLRARAGSSQRVVLEPRMSSLPLITVDGMEGDGAVLLENIDLGGAVSTNVLHLRAGARVTLRDCRVSSTSGGVFAEDDCSLEVAACVVEATRAGVEVGSSSRLVVRNSRLKCGAECNAVAAGSNCVVRVESCELTGPEPGSYAGHTRAVSCGSYSELYVIDTRILGWFSLGIIGHQASVVDVERCYITNSGEGITLWDSTAASTAGRIVGNELLELTSFSVHLNGRCSRVEITDNTIVEAESGPMPFGIALAECIESGVYGADPEGRLFSGTLVGSNNRLVGGVVDLCPARDSGFWPTGFFADD